MGPLLLCAVFAACATRMTPPAPPPPPAEGAAGNRPEYTPADVTFMQGMIPHHRQALAMTALVLERTSSEKLRLLAERIEVSQTDEITQMSRWLEERGEEVPAPVANHHGHGELMPGMLTEEEMARLAAASGESFDRLFLELMIRHHLGALMMVGELLSTPGAGQEVDAYRIASEIDSDQRIEIQRMERMLATLG